MTSKPTTESGRKCVYCDTPMQGDQVGLRAVICPSVAVGAPVIYCKPSESLSTESERLQDDAPDAITKRYKVHYNNGYRQAMKDAAEKVRAYFDPDGTSVTQWFDDLATDLENMEPKP